MINLQRFTMYSPLRGTIGRVRIAHLTVLFFSVLLFLLLLSPSLVLALDSLCAEVKIEISQELTLERQAFDAHMRINNGLDNIALENVAVEVSFADEEGNAVLASSDASNEDALFFIRLDSMDGIADVNGSGTVEPSTAADIHWLIIPASGASNGVSSGTLYYVGATLSYTIGGVANVTEITPDYIFVKPMPELTLDYFLPTDVYGDDAFTPEIEPAVPFALGVRVNNMGFGTAYNLKIDSAQPKIIENEQNLLVNFVIEGSQVNGQVATPSLLVDFGAIEPDTSGVARWIMTSSLSGQFVDFTARFSHADELGGELTSLINDINTHELVWNVLVDLPGRDEIADFLVCDNETFRVYESESTDFAVSDLSAGSLLELAGQVDDEVQYNLSTPVAVGLGYIQLVDPHDGDKVIVKVIRSDGKRIKEDNAWLSKTRDEDNNWHFFFNLFDADFSGHYTVVFADLEPDENAPIWQFIPDKTVDEGELLSFLVQASSNESVPALSVLDLPAEATFVDNQDGTGAFSWIPASGQGGIYELIFVASQGGLQKSERMRIVVNALSIALSGPDEILEGELAGPFILAVLDQEGLPSEVSETTRFALSSSSVTAVFFSDAAGTTEVSTVTLPAGQGTVSFYYRDSTAVSATLTATRTEGLEFGSVEHQLTVMPDYAEIHGLVFNDDDGDGLAAQSEAGIASVTVDLWQENELLVSTITDSSGSYSFTELSSGSYSVRETDLTGCSSTTSNQVAVDLGKGDLVDVDFGDLCESSLNLYWAGSDNNVNSVANWLPNMLPEPCCNIFLSPTVPFSAVPVISSTIEVNSVTVAAGCIIIESGSLFISGGCVTPAVEEPESGYEGFTYLWVDGSLLATYN